MTRVAAVGFGLLLLAGLSWGQAFDVQGAQSDDQLRWGVQAFNRGMYGDALVSLEKSVSLKPTNVLPQIWLGRVYWKSGFEQDALRTWERLVTSGQADSLIQDWVQTLRVRYGTARDVVREPAYVPNSELAGNLKAGHPFTRPASVRARDDGSFYVVAFGTNEIIHYDANFRFLESLRGGLQGFNHPYDVLELSDGNLLVSEYGANRITKCNAVGDHLSSFGQTGRGDGQLLGPQYLASDSSGFVYVTDWGNSRVNKYDPNGTFVLAITRLSGPSGIAIRNNMVFVSEKSAGRISIYDTSGNFLHSIGEGTVTSPEGISFEQNGRLLVADGDRMWEVDVENERWLVKADTSSIVGRLVQQVMTPNGDILAADFDENKIVYLSDPAALYAGLVVSVDRVNSVRFPDVLVDVSVQNRAGMPVTGLTADNFVLTESRLPVPPVTMVRRNTDTNTSDVALVIESSPAMAGLRSSAETAAAALYASATQGGRIKAISAGASPVKETDFGEARLRFLASAFSAAPSDKWRLDAAVRVAGEDLVSAATAAKRAVVFFTAGALGSQAYATYSLLELTAFMKNNGIAFYPVYFGNKIDPDLGYLATETGGEAFSMSTPGGMDDVMRSIRARTTSMYTLTYKSLSAPEFGTAYIPLEVEVTLQRISGRDEFGYYAPPSP